MQPTAQPQIALLAAGFIGWTGGIDFLRLCVGGLNSVMPGIDWPVLVPEASLSQRALASAVAAKRCIFRSLGREQPPMVPPLSLDHLHDTLASIGCRVSAQHYYGTRAGLGRHLDRTGAQVALPSLHDLGPNFSHPWVGYIFDLQHKRLPGYFSRRECWDRDRLFRGLLAHAPAIIVNSRAVVHDVDEFYPGRRARMFSLPFCPIARPEFLEERGGDDLAPYELPEKFFLISNQLWAHKSHETAFSALRLVRDAGFPDVHILCTGNLHDYRAPGRLEKLQAGIARDGLSNRIQFLGLIPKQHQLAVMRRSVAVLQPTLFEGGPGGGSVYDAVATGTPAIVSDIAVNLEADVGVLEFFKAGSTEEMARKMVAMLKTPPPRMSRAEILAMSLERQKKLGQTLLEAAFHVLRER